MNRLLRAFCVIPFLGMACLAFCQQNVVTVIRAGKLFTGNSDKYVLNQTIVITKDRITAMGPSDAISIPQGAKVIDLSSSTVLPGLIDAHSHIFEMPTLKEDMVKQSLQYRTIVAVANAKQDLLAGFTTMRDLKSVGALYSDVDVRNAINRGIVPGPRLQVATQGLTATGGFYPEGLGYPPDLKLTPGMEFVDGPWAARKAVREQLMYGADLIKIFGTWQWHFAQNGDVINTPTFTLQEIQAIVEEAHRRGVKVSCHAYGGEGLQNCIDANVDSIEHGFDMTDKMLSEMKQKGIYLVPTLYLYEFEEQDDLAKTGGKYSRAQIRRESFGRAVKANIKIAFGSGVGPFAHGTQAKEFTYLVKYGMSPAQAIISATKTASELMGWQDKIGTLDVGKFADVIAVSGDPLLDITELQRVGFVMKDGEVVKSSLPSEKGSATIK